LKFKRTKAVSEGAVPRFTTNCASLASRITESTIA
jgi:hypothetical protein